MTAGDHTLHIVIVVGARPNFMKASPLMRILSGNPRFRVTLVHTGQHYDVEMSDAFFRDLSLSAPDVNLEVGSGTHATQTAQIMTRFEEVCLRERPDWVVVVGDVNSTMACTLVAVKIGIKVAHVEAGLRSFDRTMPEEINRLVTDTLADMHFTHSSDADENLRREGIDNTKIKFVGNIMIDSLVSQLPKAREKRFLKERGLREGQFVYVTLHRPANVDEKESLHTIVQHLSELSRSMPVVFPIHPRTNKRLSEFAVSMPSHKGFHAAQPLGYHDSLTLAENARFVLTDSGGLQEETTFFKTPCLTLRPNTERPVTVRVGSNKLTSLNALHADIESVLKGPLRFGEIPALWDGHTAERIAEQLIT